MRNISAPQRQTGSSLIVSLIILIVLMLLGVMAMTTSDTAYKLAGNLKFENEAFNNAEAALREAETKLKNGTIDIKDFSGAADPTKGLYPKGEDILPSIKWVDTDSRPLRNLPGTPRIIVQLMSEGTVPPGEDVVVGVTPSTGCKKVNTYMITARGTSARGSERIVRSYFSTKAC